MRDLTLEQINTDDPQTISQLLMTCCGSEEWVRKMLQARPFEDQSELLNKAQEIWTQLETNDWLEAFKHHPQIGDKESLKKKFANTAQWAAQEQKGALESDEQVLEELAEYNQRYLQKFGFIFIICATGKSAKEMLTALKIRFKHSAEDELAVAASEQAKITHLRLHKLLK